MLAKVHMKEIDDLTQRTKALEHKFMTAKHTISKQKAKLDYIGHRT